MSEKIIVGPINKGLKNNVTPFNVDNDSFPTLINAYQWRGRVKRKRGTSFLNRLKRFFDSTNISYNPSAATLIFDGSGNANLLTAFSLQTNGNIVPGSVTIVGSVGLITYIDPTKDGYLTPTGTGGPNTINYSTGNIHIPAQAGGTGTAIFSYYPDLPVLGIEDLTLIPTQYPGTIAFDDVYSYNVVTSFPYPIYDVSFYKNPPSGTPATYVQKTNATPITWNGQDYQQFWTVNYQGALWATNGINVPFNITNIGMQFQKVTAPSVFAGPPVTPSIIIFTLGVNPLVIGDFVFVNEFTASTAANAATLNFQTGYVTALGAGTVTVTFPNATVAADTYSGGILQFLTNRSDITKDNIRFYDGDPTNGNSTTPTLTPGHGWVNFMPPLSQDNFSIADLPADKYYLVGSRLIVPFKDRLLFLGPVVQSSGGSPKYLQDTIIYSQNGTPYYTASWTGNIFNPNSPGFVPLLVPDNQTATPSAWWEDQTGFGGFISAGISQPIITVSSNEDVLIVGFDRLQTRVVYSGNDITPFYFYITNSELGSGSTFSVINMDEGVITRGSRGYIITSQTNSKRIDLEIPDEVFEINLTQNGNERFCATRDFINEWIYFTFPDNNDAFRYPNRTLLYNYRDNSWAIFEESYTTYGAFRRQTGFIWQTVGLVYPSWSQWNEPWDAGESTLLQQEVVAGNQQGFIVFRDEGTGESPSLYIQSFSGSTNIVTSPDHNLMNGDYIIINNCLGPAGNFVNGEIFSVFNVTQNTFQLDPDPLMGSAVYFGQGTITKMYVPQIQTKQFPSYWSMSRKVRIGVQQYLLTTTNDSQITLLIFLSQNSASAYNAGKIVPDTTSANNSLIYSTVLYTCPESTNLGLTAPNVNLQTPTAEQQAQIWHRINTSLIGDTVQLGFTISDAQMRDLEISGSTFAITGASKATLCVLNCASNFQIGQLIEISGIVGMIELNGNVYQVVSVSSTQVTIGVNSTAFTTYISGGTASQVSGINGFAEVEIHGFILDVSPSQLLS